MNDNSERIIMNAVLKHTFIALALIVPITAISAFAQATSVQQAPKTVDSVDLNQYVGTWNEVARLPMYFQRDCDSDVTATYSLQSNNDSDAPPKITVLNSCRRADGSLTQVNGVAQVVNSTGSKLEVTFLPKSLRWLPVGRANYWILALDDDYQNAMVGTPDNKYLWLLSRDSIMASDTYNRYVSLASQQGYDVSKLKVSKPQLAALD